MSLNTLLKSYLIESSLRARKSLPHGATGWKKEIDMINTSVVSRPARPSGLVSVDGRTYPLKSARLEARAEGGIAATTFTQTYGNPYEEPLEVLYTLPLPASGAVVGYSIRFGKRVIRGEVRRRAEAQEE